MKRLLCIPILLLLLLLPIFGLSACREEESIPQEEEKVGVSFSTALLPYAAMPPETQTLKKGECATEPVLSATPSAGKVVIWVADASNPSAYDFTAPVYGDLLLYAVETPRVYTITYLIEHGKNSSKNPVTYTKETETFSLYAPIMELGYKFNNKWCYFDDRESAVTEIEQGTEGDIVLRASITPIEYVVHYEDDGEENPNPKTYVFGTTLTLQAPKKEGYTFTGFTLDGDPKRTEVTALTAEFVSEHEDAIFHDITEVEKNGTDIFLLANWVKDE